MTTTATAQPAYFSTGEIWRSGTGNTYRISGVTDSHARFDPVDGGVHHWWPRHLVGRWVRLKAAGEG